MNCAECVTGSKTMMNSAGSWIDSTPFSPGASSTWSMHEVVDQRLVILLREIDAGAPVHLPVVFDQRQFVRRLCAAILRTRGLTVKVTSTISSSVGA